MSLDAGGGGRAQRAAAHERGPLQLAQALGEHVGPDLREPERRSVKRLGPSSSSRTTSSAQRSPTRSRARATPRRSLTAKLRGREVAAVAPLAPGTDPPPAPAWLTQISVETAEGAAEAVGGRAAT